MAGDGALIGKVTLDRTAGIAGSFGPGPEMVPFRITVNGRLYEMQSVRDPYLTPFLLQMAAFAAIDAEQRQVGPGSLRVEGSVSFRDASAPALRLDDVYTAASGVAQQAALGAAAPLAFLLQTAPGDLEVDAIELDITAGNADRRVRLVGAWTDRRQVEAGETVKISVALRGPDSEDKVVRHLDWTVPRSAAAGEVTLSVADASQLNALEFPMLMEAGKLPPAELIRAVNRLRRSDRLYLRVWRSGLGFRVQAQKMERAPASLRTVLGSPQGLAGGAAPEGYEVLAELDIASFDGVVDGAVSLPLEITK
jgi:hypothetical protein